MQIANSNGLLCKIKRTVVVEIKFGACVSSHTLNEMPKNDDKNK